MSCADFLRTFLLVIGLNTYSSIEFCQLLFFAFYLFISEVFILVIYLLWFSHTPDFYYSSYHV